MYFGVIELQFLSAGDEVVGCDNIWNPQLSYNVSPSICLCEKQLFMKAKSCSDTYNDVN